MNTSARRRTLHARKGEVWLSVVAVITLLVLPALLLVTSMAMGRQFAREHVLRADIQAVFDYRTNMRSVLIDLEDAETGQRGYLLTGKASYLAPYLRARGQVTKDLSGLAQTSPFRNAVVVGRLSEVTRSKFQELATTIRYKQEGRGDTALAIVLSDVGQHDMEAARGWVAAERARTSNLMVIWNRLADESARTTQQTALFIGALIVLALTGSASLISYVLLQRRRAIVTLTTAHSKVAELLKTSAIAERTSKSGHWSLSADGNDHSWSAGMFPIFGLPVADRPPSVDAVLGMYVQRDRAIVEAKLARALENQTGFEFEAEIKDAEGDCRYLRLKADYIREESKGTLIGAVQDITEERKAQLALGESETRYRHLADTSTDMMATMSIDSTILYISPACSRIIGYGPEELIGRKTLALTHPEDVPAVLAVFDGLRRAGPGDATIAYRFRGRHKDGSWVWLEGQPRVEFDPEGEPIRYQDVVREIGSRKAAEEALETSRSMALESERRYRLLAENATDMISLYGLDGVITYVSPACRKVLGYEASELIGRSTISLIHPEDLARIRDQFSAYRTSESVEAMHTEHRVSRRDGTVIWLEGRPKLMFDEAGAPIGYQDVMRDVTARKAMEAELREARGAAEAATRSKSDFLANMSHELRTPLNSIVGFAGLIVRADELSIETRRRACIVRDSSRALVEIVNDILDFSKFEAEGMVLSPEPTELTGLLRSTLEVMQHEAEVKGLRLELAAMVDPGAVLLDPARLRQVVFNLLGNAIKFTQHGAVTLGLVELPDGRLRVSVQDTGIGIAQDRLDPIFERFAQADASTSRRFGGTGLGLTICSAIVRAMGGQIGVDSVEGVGSTFSFTLDPPRLAPAMAPPSPPMSAMAPPSTPLAGLRVLVADDNVFNQELFEALMAGQGLQITCAANGREAVELAATADFDLVLMDMQMPVMDGLEATRAIRDLGLARLPVVALTANVVRSQIALCREAGMDDHLAKPYTAEAASAMIARWTVERDLSASPAQQSRRRSVGAG